MSTEVILNASPLQMLSLWEELFTALYGDNKYKGSIAEIYIFRLMPHSPVAIHPLSEYGLEAYRTGCRTLHALCRLFEERNQAMITFDDGSSIDTLLDEEPNTHRVHLLVAPAV